VRSSFVSQKETPLPAAEDIFENNSCRSSQAEVTLAQQPISKKSSAKFIRPMVKNKPPDTFLTII